MRTILITCLIFVGLGLTAQPVMESLVQSPRTPQIVIKNRVVAMINEKPITVLDLVKKMDVVFYKQFPQYAKVPEARFQFYTISWKQVLNEMVDKELVLADAAQIEMKVPDSDIRKELEETFGPNIVVNLDGAGLTLDEAKKIVQEETLFRRMLYLNVHSKVLNAVTPQVVRQAYDDYVKSFPSDNEWTYSVITLKAPSSEQLKNFATSASEKLNADKVLLSDVPLYMKKVPGYNLFTTVKISDPFKQKESELSDYYKEVLTPLHAGGYSEPLAQKRSSDDQNSVYKILYLDHVGAHAPPPFHEMAPKLKNDMIQTLSDVEMSEYKKRLRKQFPVNTYENVNGADFEPFSLEVDGRKIPIPSR